MPKKKPMGPMLSELQCLDLFDKWLKGEWRPLTRRKHALRVLKNVETNLEKRFFECVLQMVYDCSGGSTTRRKGMHVGPERGVNCVCRPW